MRPLIEKAAMLTRAVSGDLYAAFGDVLPAQFSDDQARAVYKVYDAATALQTELAEQREKPLPSGAVTVSPATIHRLRDLVHEVEQRFLIEHARPGSVPAHNGRRALQFLIKLVDEVFPCHAENPVAGLDAATVAEPGAAAMVASGEGQA